MIIQATGVIQTGMGEQFCVGVLGPPRRPKILHYETAEEKTHGGDPRRTADGFEDTDPMAGFLLEFHVHDCVCEEEAGYRVPESFRSQHLESSAKRVNSGDFHTMPMIAPTRPWL